MNIDVDKIKARNNTELQRLARLTVDAVYVMVMSYVHNNEDAEEVIQDTIMTTIDSIDSFNNRSALKTWIYRIAINKSKDLLKYKSRQKRAATSLSLEDTDMLSSDVRQLGDYYDPSKILESREDLDLLFAGINQLPTNQREALVMMKMEQMSMKEVAQTLDTTPKAVEGLISRAKNGLSAYLENQGINRL
jgi:RNA polymerase sigma-70 factor (ECF subfamily)